MNIKDFNFPEITELDMAFPTMGTNHDLLQEAKDRGFYNGNTPYNRLFSELFYNGGTVTFKSGLSPEFKKRAWYYTRALIGSFAPKHEDKEAVCAMIMSELLELNKQ